MTIEQVSIHDVVNARHVRRSQKDRKVSPSLAAKDLTCAESDGSSTLTVTMRRPLEASVDCDFESSCNKSRQAG